MGDRKYGYGKKGQKVVYKVAPGRSPNISLLPAMTMHGYLACTTFQGSVDAEAFKDFLIMDLFPRCNEYPLPKSVIVVDNAAIHHDEVQILNYKSTMLTPRKSYSYALRTKSALNTFLLIHLTLILLSTRSQ